MNIILIGYGYWGPNIAKNAMASSEWNLKGICDISRERLEKAKILYGSSIEYYTDYVELLNKDDIDAFALAVKNDVGQKIAEDVLKAGKHLFMEKPLAKSVRDAELLKELANDNDVIIHVDHIMVFHPVIRKIKEILDSGELGELIYFDSSRVNLGPTIKEDVNAMWDLAVHDLAIIDHLSNGENAEHVNAVGLKGYAAREALTYLTIQYPNFIAMLKSSWISPLKERQMIIGGTKKMIVFDELKMDRLMVYDKGVNVINRKNNEYGKYEVEIRAGDMYSPNISMEDSLLNSLNHFANCIKSKEQPITGADQAIRILKVLEEADKDISRKRKPNE
ncbi:MAG: Gfo/Idh/MocA family oxidoreductase [Eubacteriales bacterium]|nr:Gfo/Idh/MocA family oxidoreductase [Eubacteriales bacterium]